MWYNYYIKTKNGNEEMSTKYTLTLGDKKIKISFAVFFWVILGIIAFYVGSMYAAFNVIGWYALIFVTICPVSINGVSLNPWPKYVEYVMWIALIAIAIKYLMMV